MSEENIEVVRASIEARIAGDASKALDTLDPEVEWHGMVGGLDEGRLARGHEEVTQGFADYFRTWDRLELRADRYIDAGGNDVVVFIHEVAKGRASGIVVEMDLGVVMTVRDGKIIRVRSLLDREEALEAAGLSE